MLRLSTHRGKLTMSGIPQAVVNLRRRLETSKNRALFIFTSSLVPSYAMANPLKEWLYTDDDQPHEFGWVKTGVRNYWEVLGVGGIVMAPGFLLLLVGICEFMITPPRFEKMMINGKDKYVRMDRGRIPTAADQRKGFKRIIYSIPFLLIGSYIHFGVSTVNADIMVILRSLFG
jgi:hypothetical protein